MPASPLLDALEHTFPAVRAAYMGDQGAAAANDVEVRAARESHRWPIGLVFVAFAASLVVSLPLGASVPRS